MVSEIPVSSTEISSVTAMLSVTVWSKNPAPGATAAARAAAFGVKVTLSLTTSLTTPCLCRRWSW
jgi:hypothetical protein